METPKVPRDEFHIWDFPLDRIFVGLKWRKKKHLLTAVGKDNISKEFDRYTFASWNKRDTRIRLDNLVKLADMAREDHTYVENSVKLITPATRGYRSRAIGNDLYPKFPIKFDERIVRIIMYIICRHMQGEGTKHVPRKRDLRAVLLSDISEKVGRFPDSSLKEKPRKAGSCPGCKCDYGGDKIGKKCPKCDEKIIKKDYRTMGIPLLLKEIIARWTEKYGDALADEVIRRIDKRENFIPKMCMTFPKTCLKAICDSTFSRNGGTLVFSCGAEMKEDFCKLLDKYNVEYTTPKSREGGVKINKEHHIARFGRWGDLCLDSTENQDDIINILKYHDRKRILCSFDGERLEYDAEKRLAVCPKCHREHDLLSGALKRLVPPATKTHSGIFCRKCKAMIHPTVGVVKCRNCGELNYVGR